MATVHFGTQFKKGYEIIWPIHNFVKIEFQKYTHVRK